MASLSSLKDSIASLLGEAGSDVIYSLGSEQIPLKKGKHEKTLIFLEYIVVSGNLYTGLHTMAKSIFLW